MKKLYLLSLVCLSSLVIVAKGQDELELAISKSDIKKVDSILNSKQFLSPEDKARYSALASEMVKKAQTQNKQKIIGRDFCRIIMGLAGIALADYTLHYTKTFIRKYESNAPSINDESYGDAPDYPDLPKSTSDDEEIAIPCLLARLNFYALFGVSICEIYKGIVGTSKQKNYNDSRLIAALIQQMPVK